jgi:hypothetical protein
MDCYLYEKNVVLYYDHVDDGDDDADVVVEDYHYQYFQYHLVDDVFVVQEIQVLLQKDKKS